MKKLIIQNDKQENISVLLDKASNQKGLAFVAHGLGGSKEQPHIKAFAQAFFENDYTVVRFDARNTYGESEGKYEDANITNYYEDLVTVIDWAKKQKWYTEPFCLAGHSLGEITTISYAQNHPDKIKALAPISTVVSGELSYDVTPKDKLEEWEKTGWRMTPSSSIKGLTKKLKWRQFAKDKFKYDALIKADKLTMPVLLMVGELDKGTPAKHQKLLYNKLPGRKELHIVKGAPHTFRDKPHITEIKRIFVDWIKKLD